MIKLKYAPEVYTPAEDSWLLLEQVRKLAKGRVLDIGTGSGIQAITAALKGAKVFASDLSQKACSLASENFRLNKAKVQIFCSDLLSAIKPGVKFDLIIFNPPYLPLEELELEAKYLGLPLEQIQLAGGKFIILKFLAQAARHLKKGGQILFVFSSLTKLPKIKGLEILARKKFFFEEIFVASLSK